MRCEGSQQQADVVITVSLFPGVACGEYPRGSVQCFHLQASIIREAGNVKPVIDECRFLEGVAFKCVLRFGKFIPTANIVQA